jgi:hypothetical protein
METAERRRPSLTELAQAICCGIECRSETKVCHSLDHFEEAFRVDALLERYAAKETERE